MDLSSLPAMAAVQQVLRLLQPEDTTTRADVLQTGRQRGDAVRDGARQLIRAEIQGPDSEDRQRLHNNLKADSK